MRTERSTSRLIAGTAVLAGCAALLSALPGAVAAVPPTSATMTVQPRPTFDSRQASESRPAVGAHPAPAPAPAVAPRPDLALGVNVTSRPGRTRQQVLQDLETQLGRPFATYRAYDDWDSPFPEPFDLFLRDSDHTQILSFSATTSTGTRYRYADLVAAAPGSPRYLEMVGWADRVKSYGAPIWVSFQHEPEIVANAGLGTPEEYAAAFRRLRSIFDERGATNARWVFIGTALGFIREVTQPYYPGDDVVEAVAADGFNAYGCRGAGGSWRPFADIFDGLRIFGRAHPAELLMVAEVGVVEDPERPGRKAAWISEIRSTLADPAWSQLRVLSYFNRPTPNVGQPFCEEQIATSSTASAAFAELAADPLFAAPDIVDPADPTATVTGQVTGGLRNPIAGATVRLIDPFSRQTLLATLTDATGGYRLTVGSGTYDLRASAPTGRGFAPLNRIGVAVTGTETVNLSMTTAGLVKLSGRLQDGLATPAIKHRIALQSASGEVESTITDGAGRFALRVPAGSYRLRIFAVGFKPFPRQDVAGPGLTLTTDRVVTLQAPVATLTIAVVDAAGRPVPDASIDLGCPATSYQPLPGLTVAGSQCVGHTWADPTTGRAVFYGLPSGAVTLSVLPPAGSGLRPVLRTGQVISTSRTITVTLPAG